MTSSRRINRAKVSTKDANPAKDPTISNQVHATAAEPVVAVAEKPSADRDFAVIPPIGLARTPATLHTNELVLQDSSQPLSELIPYIGSISFP